MKRQCADTAALVGLHDRGVLAPGKRADVNLVDFDALGVGPAGDDPATCLRVASASCSAPTGYRATLVAGEVIMRDGEPTGALPGRLVRGERGER